MEVDKGSDQVSHLAPLNEILEDEKNHNLMSWLISIFQFLALLILVFILLMTTAILAAVFQDDVSLY